MLLMYEAAERETARNEGLFFFFFNSSTSRASKRKVVGFPRRKKVLFSTQRERKSLHMTYGEERLHHVKHTTPKTKKQKEKKKVPQNTHTLHVPRYV